MMIGSADAESMDAVQTQTAQAQTAQAQSTQTQSAQTQPAQTQSAQAQSAQTQPAQTQIAQAPLILRGAQNSQLSLPDVQSLALRKNRDVQRATLEVRKLESSLRAVQASRLPSMLCVTFVGQQVNSPYKGNLAVLPGVFQPVTQQYRLSMQERAARLQLKIAKQQLRLAKQFVVAEVKTTYLRMVALKSAIVSRQQNLDFLVTLEDYVAAEVRRGAALKVDLMVVQAKRARAEYELERDKDELITVGQTLNRLLDRPIKTCVEVVTDEQVAAQAEMDGEVVIAQATEGRPEIAQARMNADRFHLEQKISLSKYIPDISFGATGIFSKNLDITLPRTFLSVGFLGVWEPWDWGRRIELGKVAERQRRQTLIELDDLTDKVSVEADNARRALGVVAKEVRAAALAETSTKEQLRIANSRYRAGSAVLKDVTEAQSAYTEAISDFVKARSDYATAQVDFDKAVGKDFD